MEKQAAPGANRKKVIVDAKKGKKLRQKVEQFEKLFKQCQQQFSTSTEELYFLISTKFIAEWREYCTSESEERYEPSPYNYDLLDSDGKTLRPGLTEGADFEIVNSDIVELFREFTGKRFMRKARMVGHQKKVQIRLNSYQYLPLSNTDLKHIDNKSKSKQEFKSSLKTIQESEQATIRDFKQTIIFAENLSPTSCQIRLWKLDKKDPENSLENVYNHIVKKCKPFNYYTDFKIQFLGKRIDDLDTKLCDLNLEVGDYFVIQYKQIAKDWYLQTDSQGKCEGCFKIRELPFPCACKKVAYCTESCKEKDKRYHYNRCPAAQQQQINQKVQMRITSSSSEGLVGLTNLGNTCFMNSCLQCLSNTLPLTQYFLDQHYQQEINKQNLLGTKGKLAKCYAKFIKAMWCDSDSTFSPYNLKSAVSNINPMFSGYAQHDSQEFFSFIVDGLHEDLNRIQKKPYVQSVESKGRDQKVVALESWVAHTKRNRSIIVDLMTGQYKSKVTCPDCKKQSITFDPFITVTLPIPQQLKSTLEYFVIHHNFQSETKKMSFTYKKPNIEEWHQKAAELIKTDPRLVRMYILTMHEGIYGAGIAPLSEIVNKIQNQNKNVFLIEFSEEEVAYQEPIQFTARCSKKSHYYNSYENVWFKFPLLFEKGKTNGLTIYKRFLRFLYNETYDNSTKRSTFFSGKSYESYEKIMLENRPFELYLRYGQKSEKYYHRTEFKFENDRHIKDNMSLSEILEGTDVKDCELDARFDKEGSKNFSFEQLKHFKDTTERWSRGKDSSEDVTVTLQQCLQHMREPQLLQQGNEWFCPQCKDHKLATKQLSLYKAPKVLILHLKRFKQKGSLRKEKNESKVIFPMSMDFSPYLIDSSPMSSYKTQMIKEGVYIQPQFVDEQRMMTNNGAQYELYAVSNHYGGLGGGHYTAYAKNNGKWYDFNDSSVRSAHQGSVCGSGAYILFYKRKD